MAVPDEPRFARVQLIDAWGKEPVTIVLASGTPHLPQNLGGLEINTHALAVELTKRGRRTAVFCGLSPRDRFGIGRLLKCLLMARKVSRDDDLGYAVYRSRKPWRTVKALPQSSVAVVQNGNMVELGNAFLKAGIPSIAYLHGLEFDIGARRWTGLAADLPFSAYIANSRYTAERFKNRFGVEASVIAPVFRPEAYRTDGDRRFVTFVNPVPEKGLEIALSVATLCPDINFQFVKAWSLKAADEEALERRVAALPNVEIRQRSQDMRPIYASTRILLAPSQWEAETWGRIASEAHFSGIPVLGSDRGGLPESIGPGGSLVPYDAAPDIWAAELRRLWSDDAYWRQKSLAALDYSRRQEISISAQVPAFLKIVDSVVAGRRRT